MFVHKFVEHTNGNIVIIANVVHSWKPRLDSCTKASNDSGLVANFVFSFLYISCY